MRNSIRASILCSLVFSVVCCLGCNKADHGEHQVGEPTSGEPPLIVSQADVGKDIKIPGQIFKTAEGDAKLATSGFSFFPIKVILQEKNSGVLSNREIIFELPKGGGRIDLANYIGTVPGSFYLKFDFEAEKSDRVAIFFVSEAKARKIDQEKWGLGCRRYADVTNYVQAQNKGLGIKVNTTRKRHLAVIGGSFIFTLNDGKRMSMSHVTFDDSGSKEYFCDARGS